MEQELMSDQELKELALVRSALKAQSWLMKWMVGGFVGMIAGAVGVGMWVANQQHEISQLAAEDKRIAQEFQTVRGDSSELRGQVNLLYKDMALQRQEIALQGRDIQFIREKLVEMVDLQKKMYETTMARKP